MEKERVVLEKIRLNTKSFRGQTRNLKAGDQVSLSGMVYTARDAAHKQIFTLMEKGKPLPFSMEGVVICYAGPTPTPEGMAIGSCGSTTSDRMDPFAPHLLDMGLAAMVGKGDCPQEVVDAICRNGALYLCAINGAGALAAQCVQSLQVVALDDLGCESVKRLELRDLLLVVTVDSKRNSLFLET